MKCDVWTKSMRNNETQRKRIVKERCLSLRYYQRHSITILIFFLYFSLFHYALSPNPTMWHNSSPFLFLFFFFFCSFLVTCRRLRSVVVLFRHHQVLFILVYLYHLLLDFNSRPYYILDHRQN